MLPGVVIQEIRKSVDERGFFAEVFRDDWKDLIGSDKIAQSNISLSQPGIVRAWHKHKRGQVDYFLVLRGAVRICVFDDREGSPTKGQLDEIVSSDEKLQLVRVPGFYWHGTKAISPTQSLILYLVTRLYDQKDPDEDRRPWNDPKIIDPKTAKPYDWERVPYK